MPSAITYQEVAERTDTQIPEHLEAQATVPDGSEGARQGDVIVIPEKHEQLKGKAHTIAGKGYKVVAGEADRNSHILNGEGMFYPGSYRDSIRDYGVLVVPEGGEAVLTHTHEHGSIRFTEGSYRVMGQLDESTEQRVAD